MRPAKIFLAFLAFVPSIRASGEPSAQTPAEEYQAILREFDEACQDFVKSYKIADGQYGKELRAARTEQEQINIVNEHYPKSPKPVFQERFMALARKYPASSTTIDAIVWVFRNPWWGLQAEKNVGEAFAILGRDHLDDPLLGRACLGLAHPLGTAKKAGGLNDAAEKLLRLALEKSPHRRVRGQACYSLACYLDSHARWRSAGMTEPVAEKMHKEAERLFEQVVERYADVEAPYRANLGTLASAELFAMHELVVGKVAPDIQGEDIDGKPMSLSDYRGNVVVLSFWATWCGPCMAMVPHERALVERLAGKPFVLLGINGDEDRTRAKKVVERERISWRSWWNGGENGPIATRWNVDAWPTVYVLDRDGVIRSKIIDHSKELDTAVDTVLSDIKATP